MEPLITPKDVSKLLSVSLSLVYLLAKRGELECIQWECPRGEKSERQKKMLRFEKQSVIDFKNRYKRNGQS